MPGDKNCYLLTRDSMRSESSQSDKATKELNTSQDLLPKTIKRQYRSSTEDENSRDKLPRSRTSSFSSDFELDEDVVRYQNELTKLTEAYNEAISKAKAYGEEKEFQEMDKTIEMILQSSIKDYAINNIQFWITWAELEALRGDVNSVIKIYSKGCDHFKDRPMDYITLGNKMRFYVNRIQCIHNINDLLRQNKENETNNLESINDQEKKNQN